MSNVPKIQPLCISCKYQYIYVYKCVHVYMCIANIYLCTQKQSEAFFPLFVFVWREKQKILSPFAGINTGDVERARKFY